MDYLKNALDYGIKECEFWDMTLAELERAVESKLRVKKNQDQEKAIFDYILADLIGRSVARVVNANNTMPEISEVYPNLFEKTALKHRQEEKKAELSALRFKLFANSFNTRFKEVAKSNE
jgi:hypothetical protein